MNRLFPSSKLVYFCMVSATTLLIIYTFWNLRNEQHNPTKQTPGVFNFLTSYNIWLIFTRVGEYSPLRYKFSSIVRNLLNVTSVKLRLHIIVDDSSRKLAVEELQYASTTYKKKFLYVFYNISEVVLFIEDIVGVMQPHFSSNPGTYYSDALFYISLGLYRFAPADQDYAVLLDCDLYFKDDVALLFKEFLSFKPSALFGLAPELSPVYRHILHRYKKRHKTTFGEFYNSTKDATQSHPLGFQGYNSGIVLLNIRKIRQSKLYPSLLTNDTVNNLTAKYLFRGHLGDQDFYTLIGYDYPQLIQTLNCGFNRQVCTWWRDHGYGDIFGNYSKCVHKTIAVHGNCNTKIVVN